jgi:hypothetical protein
MAKAKLKEEFPTINGILKRRVHSIHPWSLQHHPDHSEIEAYIEITGKMEIIAVIKSINHADIAEFIVALANEHNRKPILESITNPNASKR